MTKSQVEIGISLLIIGACVYVVLPAVQQPNRKHVFPGVYNMKLVGTWEAALKGPDKPAIRFTFGLNGSGHRDGQEFEWAADGQRLWIQHLAVDFWSQVESPYTVSPDGRELTIAHGKDSPYSFAPTHLRRAP